MSLRARFDARLNLLARPCLWAPRLRLFAALLALSLRLRLRTRLRLLTWLRLPPRCSLFAPLLVLFLRLFALLFAPALS